MSEIMAAEKEAVQEYLWAPEVHEALGERMVFYFLRSAYNKLALVEFKRILEESRLPSFSYVLFGQFDFLARVWGNSHAVGELEAKLREFSRRFLGDCIPIEVKRVSYFWAGGNPKPEAVKEFVDKLRQLDPKLRFDYVHENKASLRSKHLIVEDLVKRQGHTLKAFTVIRNLNLAAQSYTLMERVISDEVVLFCKTRRRQDATLYSTRGDIHFIVRWGVNDFPELTKAITSLLAILENHGFAVLLETYFRAGNVEVERDNPVLFSETIKEQKGPVADDDERRWEELVPQLKEATVARRELFLHLTKAKEFELSPAWVKSDEALREVLANYFQESVAGFGAFMRQFYAQFETALRNWLLAWKWPADLTKQSETLQEWQILLGRTQPIATGTDSGRVVPKLSLGDLLRLARAMRPDGFDPSIERRLEDLLRLRNQLTHGTAVVDFDMFIPFLTQASACAKVLNALKTEIRLPKQ
jgi:hypothetical protein